MKSISSILNNSRIKWTAIIIAVLSLSYFLSDKLFFRWDLTQEKRYSISDNTISLLEGIDGTAHAKVYLDGDLNSGFLRLRRATKEMLDEFKLYSHGKLTYEFINPNDAVNNKAREKKYNELEKRGLRRIPVYDKDEEGNPTMKVVFPWCEITYKDKKGKKHTKPVNLLKNIQGRSGEENLNLSEQGLEYELTNTLRLLTVKKVEKVAFLEGHGEWREEETYEITKTLSEYYQVDRGVLGGDCSLLGEYVAIIIAGPTEKFNEADKYAIDQYIMNGGKVLWFIDGARISLDSLSRESQTIGIVNDVNLNDQLFRYGIRINPTLLQDVQCVSIPVNMAREGDPTDFKPAPWYYSPLLITNPYHSMTRNLTPIRTDFVSSIDFVGDSSSVVKTVLLATSAGTHIQQVPSMVSMDVINIEQNGYYFNVRNVAAAALLEGTFSSIYRNRMIPEGVRNASKTKDESIPTKMIVVADGDVIRNNVQGAGATMRTVPLGYDSYMNRQFGNSDFVLNCVNYLTDEDGWMDLRNREVKLRLLNKAHSIGQKKFWQWTNVALPVILLGIFAGVHYFLRRRKYAK